MSQRKLRISFGGVHHANVTKVRELEWSQLCQWLIKDPPISPNKESRGWYAGAVFSNDYRHGDNFIERNILTLDFDHVEDTAFSLLTQKLQLSGHAFAAYTTWSHLDTGKGSRFRIVLPLSRGASYDEFQAVSRKFADKLCGIELAAGESHVPAQFMFSPTRREGGEHLAEYNVEGKFVDVDKILALYSDWTDRSQWPRRKEGDNPYDKDQISSPLDKPGPVGDFCRAFSISLAIERFQLPYIPTSVDGRWTYTGGSRPEGAVVYDDDTKLHSHHDTDPARGQSNAFDLVRLHRFHSLDGTASEGTPVTDLPSYRAMCQFTYEQQEVQQALAKENFEDLGDLTPDQLAEFKPLTQEQSLGAHEILDGKPVGLARRISDVLRNPTVPRWLIRDELERAVIAVMAGPRGSFKSFIALDWAMRCATATNMGHPVDKAHPVYVVSAEGGDFDRRARAWLKYFLPERAYEDVPLYVVERRLDLNSAEGIIAIRDDCVRLQIRPVLFVLDTFSKLSGGLDENDNSQVKQFIGRLDNGLKRAETAFDATVVVVCHTGHSDAGRPRGASALAADTDAEYIVARAEGAQTVSVTRERFKASPELPPLNFRAESVPLGYQDQDGQEVTSLVMLPVAPPKKRTGEKPQGRWQQLVFEVLDDLTGDGEPAFVATLLNEACARFPVDTENAGRDTRRSSANAALQGLVQKKIVFLHPGNRVALHDIPVATAEEWLE
jgi:AAA domain-containing protein